MIGIDAVPVTVEVDISNGLGVHLVGLADVAVKESLLRTMTAIQAVGFRIPGKKIVINLAPADMHKSGSGYDLPIALGIIAASGQVELPMLGRYIIMGELGLDGTLRPVSGAIPIAELAEKNGFEGCIMPESSALEAVDCQNIKIFGVKNLHEALRILQGEDDVSDLLIWNTDLYREYYSSDMTPIKESSYMDFAEIIGQEGAKRGMEIAAAGGHNAILIGSPGSGKSSMAKALAGILPPMTKEEAIITSKIYSVAGRGSSRYGLMRCRPFRAPHYSASMAAIIGGGNGDNIIPGEVSLAENGVLFLDEFGQIPKSISEALRGPLEDREVTISRLRSKIVYPASFMLIAACNPCPCGYYGEGERCTCTPSQRQNYMSKLSGPILDRIDIQLHVFAVPTKKLVNGVKGESSAEVAARVKKARDRQLKRFAEDDIFTNAEMSNKHLEKYCPLDDECKDLLEKIISRMGLSARAYSRIIKVARTIADLEEAENIRPSHLSEAAGYRFLDRSNYGR